MFLKTLKRIVSGVIISAMISGLAVTAGAEENTELPDVIDMSKWQYEESSDVYWQVGISYCSSPADESYETLGIYVPGSYFTSTQNDDGTYTCEINTESEVASYTAETAPIVIPVNTPGY